MNTRRKNFYLASYLATFCESNGYEMSEQELEEYFQSNGWILYDSETMKEKLDSWKAERKMAQLVH